MRNVADERNGIERLIGCDEQLITLTEATNLLPRIDGKKVAVCTLWRWCRQGLRPVRLENVRIGDGSQANGPRCCWGPLVPCPVDRGVEVTQGQATRSS